MKYFRFSATVVAACVLFVLSATAQSMQTVPFDSPRWELEGPDHSLVLYKGKEALRLQGSQAWLDDVSFSTGTFEFDIAFPAERGFQGVRWQLQDRGNFEEFYFRSHLSDKPDANQYNPVIGGYAAWQLYFGEEYSTPLHYDGEWMHVRIVVDETGGEVYVDSVEPRFRFVKKGHFEPGGFGVYASQLNVAYFANFSYRPGLEVLRSEPVVFPETDPGTVTSWEVAGPWGADWAGAGATSFSSGSLTWSTLEAEERGITNLARTITGMERTHVAARVVMESSSATVKTVDFGYSDRVAVYLNGRLLYRGDNTWTSRDYRYLGTIGLFDQVALDLERGRNELVFVVTEAFGGFGVMARFADTDGLRFTGGTVQE